MSGVIPALQRFSAASPAFRRHLVTAFAELLRARVTLALVAERELLRRLTAPAAENPDATALDLAMVSRALAAAAARVPWRADCLVQVIAADRWLRRHGHAPRFHIGVDRPGGDAFVAHAWLTCGGVTVTGGDPARFTVLVGEDAPASLRVPR